MTNTQIAVLAIIAITTVPFYFDKINIAFSNWYYKNIISSESLKKMVVFGVLLTVIGFSVVAVTLYMDWKTALICYAVTAVIEFTPFRIKQRIKYSYQSTKANISEVKF